MSDSRIEGADYIADAEEHNGWWSGDRLVDLEAVADLKPRSDLLKFVQTIDRHWTDDRRTLVYPIYGPTGIGKTTLLKQFVAAVVDDDRLDVDTGHRDLSIAGAVDPRRVLYVPLEESLYHLERPDDALAELERVVDYFRSHVAPRAGRTVVLLDDVGALRLDGERKRALVDLVDDETYLVLTGIVESQVDLRAVPGADRIDEVAFPRPMLPMKFVDTVQQGVYDDTALATADPAFADRIEALRTDSVEGDSLVDAVRRDLGDPSGIDDAVEALDRLHFEAFSPRERDGLHEAAREYLQRGGLFHRVDDPLVNNDLARSHFLLYLHKELAGYTSIQRPENLHRLSSIAASRAGEELRYTDVSDQLEVDRRTVDSYLSVLDEGLSVSESHDYSLQRHRRTRLYLRNPRHVVLLSQRQEHRGFESYEPTASLNHEFEYKLARTVAFDHAKRLSYSVSETEDPPVEYCETDAGTVEYVLHNGELVLPFVLSYHPHAGDAEEIATAFDPAVGKHPRPDGEELRDLDYAAPYRFVVADSLPADVRESGSLVRERDGETLCYLPFWLFLLVC